MSKATKDALNSLHGALAEKLADAIDEMSHETKGLAAILNVARQFLKDNNIEATAAPGSHMANLANKVAEFPFDPERDAPLN